MKLKRTGHALFGPSLRGLSDWLRGRDERREETRKRFEEPGLEIASFQFEANTRIAFRAAFSRRSHAALGFQKVDDGSICRYDTFVMTAIAKKLDARLNRWAPETAKKVKQLVAEIIELADHDALDLVRSRKVEQEVLDIIDGRKSRVRSGLQT